MSDARFQQAAAAAIAIIALIGYILLEAFAGGVSDGAGTLLGGTVLTLIGFLVGNVKTNGVAGARVSEAHEALATRVAEKVKEG